MITGANRGIGLEFARQYAADGWHVVATCRSPENAQALIATGAEVLSLDVTDFDSFPAFAARFADSSLDILLNNAGIDGDVARSALDADIDTWLTAFRTNAMAPAILTRHLLPNLRRAGRPVGATIGSVDGLFDFVTGADKVVYTSTKAAAHMVTISLAQALKEAGVIYLSLRPGRTQTDMTGGEGSSAEESVGLMRGVLEKATLAQSGKFVDRSGRIFPYSGDFEH